MPYDSFSTPFGPLTVFEDEGSIVAIEFGRAPDSEKTPLLEEARRQLNAYFDGRLKSFDLPLAAKGSPFQKRVWQHLSGIEYGRTETYGEVAEALGSAARAVGGACGRNPIVIVVPCHRVVGADKKLTGFSAEGGIDTKRALLRLEGASGY
ncbi:MAG: methylated-DNA--[protein]-cysteine S-methyltransferase [Rhodospirillales bacterium]|nr:methylated-DNA--[protein]-cysteine S-methyltransferase [Rhodospirillales bacterium]